MDFNADFESEKESIVRRFERRHAFDPIPYPKISAFQMFSRFEREYWIGQFLKDHFGNLDHIKMLEVGAGSGANVYSFYQLGIRPENFYGNELVPSLVESLSKVIPRSQIFAGDILGIPTDSEKFDVIYIGTVFSSILNEELSKAIAEHIWKLVMPGGLVLWYDIKFNNPFNREVRGISRAEVKRLFPNASLVKSRSITLPPPIGRRVGRLYNFINFSFLRSHLLCALASRYIP